MLFQTQFYVLIFLPLVAAVYYCVAWTPRGRQWILIGASLVFYGWWDVRFLLLPILQISATWILALVHDRTGYKAVLVVGVVMNLASLATFKYLNFLLASIETVSGLDLPRADIILPIGISFFSFQLISYLVDRLRGDAPIYPYREFALFVLLYPHLIAGPIVRHSELIPQFSLDPRREGMWRRISLGLLVFTVGFAKKVFFADALAKFADPLFAQATSRMLDFGEAWGGALAFSLQLFLDFSAYTEMAIGSALVFGLLLPENFRRPYLATDLREFWRRWHISLSSFLRDYLYIPLGGSRNGTWRYVTATLCTMALCGLWHGAAWTYVAWGLWHGVGLVACHTWQRLRRPMPALAGWAITMLFVIAGWVLFRASNFETAGRILRSLAGGNGFDGSFQFPDHIIVAALISAFMPPAHEMIRGLTRPYYSLSFGCAAVAVYGVLKVGQGAPVNFIYFQF
jgi:alginate O-acetyltransferase complex protein AlgI